MTSREVNRLASHLSQLLQRAAARAELVAVDGGVEQVDLLLTGRRSIAKRRRVPQTDVRKLEVSNFDFGGEVDDQRQTGDGRRGSVLVDVRGVVEAGIHEDGRLEQADAVERFLLQDAHDAVSAGSEGNDGRKVLDGDAVALAIGARVGLTEAGAVVSQREIATQIVAVRCLSPRRTAHQHEPDEHPNLPLLRTRQHQHADNEQQAGQADQAKASRRRHRGRWRRRAGRALVIAVAMLIRRTGAARDDAAAEVVQGAALEAFAGAAGGDAALVGVADFAEAAVVRAVDVAATAIGGQSAFDAGLRAGFGLAAAVTAQTFLVSWTAAAVEVVAAQVGGDAAGEALAGAGLRIAAEVSKAKRAGVARTAIERSAAAVRPRSALHVRVVGAGLRRAAMRRRAKRVVGAATNVAVRTRPTVQNRSAQGVDQAALGTGRSALGVQLAANHSERYRSAILPGRAVAAGSVAQVTEVQLLAFVLGVRMAAEDAVQIWPALLIRRAHHTLSGRSKAIPKRNALVLGER